MPWFRWSLSSLLIWKPLLNHRPVHVGFVMDKVALGQVFIPAVRFYIPISFHQCSILNFMHLQLYYTILANYSIVKSKTSLALYKYEYILPVRLEVWEDPEFEG